jgi:predicted  nucleic acid-binding Zn-ribbon protein
LRVDAHPLPIPVQEALSRLAQALDRLDAASLRHAEGERLRATLEAELALMREDRHKLATEIDKERDERLTLETRLADITPRIDRAMEAIRIALADEER